jgi:two-component system sensor histidine kinase BaeS
VTVEPEPGPHDEAPGDGEARNPWRDEWRGHWRDERRHEWRAEWGAGRRWGDGRRGPPAARFVGCFVVFVVLVASLVLALFGWLVAAVVDLFVPGQVIGPPVAVVAAIAVVLGVVLLVGTRVFGSAVNPLTEIAEATDRLADGEPGVRVRPRGPRPVRRLAGSFNTMAERLDRTRDDRRSMLADVTHELRTPLTVVQGGLEAMVDGVHPMDEDHLAPILAQTEVMARLLDDLRTLSLADAGALTLHREPADLAAIAREVVAANVPLAKARGVTLATAGETRLVTEVDPVRVGEIVANLVANAVRYTPSGGRVEVEVTSEGDDAVVTVRDNGSGIDPEELPRVFDRFQRHADTGGTGLGLAIVRDLAAAHGGTVEATSEGVPGRGSTFRVRLPRRD